MAQIVTPNFDRRDFMFYVAKKLKHITYRYHVVSVISILFDEIVKDLKKGVVFKIGNFGNFALKQLKDRPHNDFQTGKVVMSRGKKTIRFSLAKEFRKFLIDRLDIDKTYADEHDE